MIAFWEFFYHDLGKTYTDLALTPGTHRYAATAVVISPFLQSINHRLAAILKARSCFSPHLFRINAALRGRDSSRGLRPPGLRFSLHFPLCLSLSRSPTCWWRRLAWLFDLPYGSTMFRNRRNRGCIKGASEGTMDLKDETLFVIFQCSVYLRNKTNINISLDWTLPCQRCFFLPGHSCSR